MGRSNEPTDVFRFIDTKNGDTQQCWPWTGALSGRDKRGYIWINGKRHLGYRVVFELFYRPLEEGEKVRHKCDNQVCHNPFHLIGGTLSDNNRDAKMRDRIEGTLSMSSARAIRAEYVKATHNGERAAPRGLVADLARRYGVDHAIISRIVHNKTYLEHDDAGLGADKVRYVEDEE